jgi:hypothetical protein
MSNDDTSTGLESRKLSYRGRFTVARCDWHLASVAKYLRELDVGERSIALLSMAEGVLTGSFKPKPITMAAVEELQEKGPLIVSFCLTPKSNRFRNLRKVLAGATNFRERCDCLSSVIDPVHFAAIGGQLRIGEMSLIGTSKQETPASFQNTAQALPASAVQQKLPESEQQHSFTNMGLGKPAKTHKELMKGMCLSIASLAKMPT